jgi:hypothetical protein
VNLEVWLGERIEDAPASLRERVIGALGEAARGEREGSPDSATVPASFHPLPVRLRDLAERVVADAHAAPRSRDGALALLAADALLTLAVEVEATSDT